MLLQRLVSCLFILLLINPNLYRITALTIAKSSVCTQSFRISGGKLKRNNHVLPLHLWLIKHDKTKKARMTVVDFLVTFQIVDYWLVWILKRHFERYILYYSVGISQVGIAVHGWKIVMAWTWQLQNKFKVSDKSEEKHVPQWCKLTINRLQLSISSLGNHSFKRSDLYISRFPQKLLLASDSNPS